jgi:hypothetical protein
MREENATACLKALQTSKNGLPTLPTLRNSLVSLPNERQWSNLGRYTQRYGGVGMEEYNNEWLDKWVGRRVLVKQLAAPELEEELAEKIREDPRTVRTEPLKSQTGVLELESYDRLGVTLLTLDEDRLRTFVPWSALIEISATGGEDEPENAEA